MNLKAYFLIIGLCLSLGACTHSQTVGGTNSPTASYKDPLETFLQACSTEFFKYCQNVTPGDGREFACIYAREDQLSNRCENALYDAANQLETAVAELAYLAAECDADIENHCANFEPGEGRIMDCMETHLNTVSKRCQLAMQKVGWKK